MLYWIYQLKHVRAFGSIQPSELTMNTTYKGYEIARLIFRNGYYADPHWELTTANRLYADTIVELKRLIDGVVNG